MVSGSIFIIFKGCEMSHALLSVLILGVTSCARVNVLCLVPCHQPDRLWTHLTLMLG